MQQKQVKLWLNLCKYNPSDISSGHQGLDCILVYKFHTLYLCDHRNTTHQDLIVVSREWCCYSVYDDSSDQSLVLQPDCHSLMRFCCSVFRQPNQISFCGTEIV